MRVYIDATHDQALWRLWGMSLLERLLRQLAAAGAGPVLLRVRPGPDAGAGSGGWRRALRPDYPGGLEVTDVSGPPDGAGLTLVLDGAAVYDRRILERLLAATGPTLIRGVPHAQVVGGRALPGRAATASDAPVEVLDLGAMPTYLANLRRHRAPQVLPIRTAEELAAAEASMFEAVYKGVTDVVTKYVYPPIVKAMVRWLAPTRITPNQVTAVSMLLSFGAIPVFLAGHLGLGVVMGLVMSVLDSVDGKLARLTLRESRSGNWMDHGSDFVYFGIWLAVVGMVAGVGASRWLLFAGWLLDRGVVGIFRLARRRELNDWAPIDAAFRLVVIRRNIFLIVLGAGVIAGAPHVSVAALAAWALIGVAFHAARTGWILATDEPPTASRLHGEVP
jgi:phosphatidylglycerophosphate synthase